MNMLSNYELVVIQLSGFFVESISCLDRISNLYGNSICFLNPILIPTIL